MNAATRRGTVALCLGISLLAATASAAGVFMRGDGATAATTSIRGETYDYATNGVYAYNAIRIVAEGVGWDFFTLLFAVPALLLTLPWIAKGSLRARLLAVGLLGYLLYQYLMYAVTWAFGPLFPLFVAVYSASLLGIVWIVSTVELGQLAKLMSERFPRKAMALLSVTMAGVLLVMWVGRIAGGLRGALQGVLLGQTTMVVPAMDLGLIVPLCILTAALAWRRHPAGYLLASVLVVKMVAMAAAICAMLLAAWRVEGSLEVGPFVLFATAAGVAAVLGARMYRSVRPPPAPAAPAHV